MDKSVCLVANIIKYLWRYENKNGIEDVMKADWYLQKLLQHLENEIENKPSYISLKDVIS